MQIKWLVSVWNKTLDWNELNQTSVHILVCAIQKNCDDISDFYNRSECRFSVPCFPIFEKNTKILWPLAIYEKKKSKKYQVKFLEDETLHLANFILSILEYFVPLSCRYYLYSVTLLKNVEQKTFSQKMRNKEMLFWASKVTVNRNSSRY